jgi:triosephosphate isomerase
MTLKGSPLKLNEKIIVANWKMNGNADFTTAFINEINQVTTRHHIIVCPPAPLISFFSNFKHHVGAQNCFSREAGAFTGENSPLLLKALGCNYVLLGHSERRAIFGESDDFIHEKWRAAVAQDVTPIVCVGENLQNLSGRNEILRQQLLPYQRADLRNTIFAYEPAKSIGTGKVPPLHEISAAMTLMANILAHSCNYCTIYGGSVNASNAAALLNCSGVDGLLIGGASLRIDEFKLIVKNCNDLV